uniref:Uncharacterized protein n=1 Tax=Mola mola TaxID=94237 RepID=A0A3Q3XJD0_MOLML
MFAVDVDFLQLQLEVELLKLEKRSADVTHSFYLAQRFQTFQTFCSHLQNLLKEQNSLRQRLATPLGRTNLPVHLLAHVGEVESLANQLCMTTFDPSPSFLGCVFCVVFVILCNSGFYFGNKNKL